MRFKPGVACRRELTCSIRTHGRSGTAKGKARAALRSVQPSGTRRSLCAAIHTSPEGQMPRTIYGIARSAYLWKARHRQCLATSVLGVVGGTYKDVLTA